MIRKILLVLLALALAFALFEWLTWPDVAALAEENPETTAFMELRKRELERAGEDPDLDHRWVSYERISPHLRRAVIVSEDSAFYEHAGFDREELEASIRKNLSEGKIARGGSTITQQLAKNLWLSPSRNPWRKVKELILARQLERELSKKRILEIYLNVVELGERAYGAEAAAREHFGKSARSLTPREAALLAGALPNPRVMNPSDPNARLRARQKIILSRMRRWGYLADEVERGPAPAVDAASEEPERSSPSSAPGPFESSAGATTTDIERDDDLTPTQPDETTGPDVQAPVEPAAPDETATSTPVPPVR